MAITRRNRFDNPIQIRFNKGTDDKKPRAQPRHLESDLQIACVRWFRLRYPKYASVLFATPNAGKRTTKIVKGVAVCIGGKKLNDEGMTAGVADLILLTPRGKYGSLCIEMKAGKGKQSDKQKEWQEAAETANNKYVLCRTIEEFMNEVNEYLNS